MYASLDVTLRLVLAACVVVPLTLAILADLFKDLLVALAFPGCNAGSGRRDVVARHASSIATYDPGLSGGDIRDHMSHSNLRSEDVISARDVDTAGDDCPVCYRKAPCHRAPSVPSAVASHTCHARFH